MVVLFLYSKFSLLKQKEKEEEECKRNQSVDRPDNNR